MSEQRFWLIVESRDNWQIDKENNFGFFGVGTRHEKLAASVQAGDLLAVYISGVGKFADIRRVTQAGIKRLGSAGNYDRAFPFCLSTEPFITAEPKNWASMKDLREYLPLTKGKVHWSPFFQTALRELSRGDMDIIIEALSKRAEDDNLPT